MDLSRIYTKTSKGILEGNAKTRALTREHGRVLVLIDGKSTLNDILEKSTRLSQSRLAAILDELVEAGLIRLLSGNLAADDLGFSSTIIVSEADTQAFFDAQADVERELRRAEDRDTRAKIADRESLMKEVKADIDAEAEALKQQAAERQAQERAEQDMARRQVEETARQAEQARQAAEAASKRAQLEAKARAEAESRAKALEVEVHMRTEMARKVKQEAEQRALAETQAKTRMETEKKARQQAEKKAEEAVRAREVAERRARDELEAKARLAKDAAASSQRELEAKILAEEEAQHRAEMEARLREMEHAKNQAQEEVHTLSKALDEARVAAELETRVKRRMEARAREEAKTRERQATEAQAKLEQEAQRRAEAEEARARAEEEARIETERQAQAKLAAERKAREEAEKKAHAANEARAKTEKEAQKRQAAEAQAKLEQEAQRRAEAEARARAEAEARLEAERQAQAKLEAERKAHEEAEKKAHEAAEAHAKTEKEAQERLVVEAQAKLEQEVQRRAEAEARALAEEEARLEAERQAQAEAVRAHAEAEARAVAEAEEAIRLEAEAAKHQLQEQQREEAARRVHEAAERELEAERQARAAAEATAKTLVAERAKMEGVAKSREGERQRAREEAEAKARAETEEALRRVQDETRQEEEDEARLREEAQARAMAAAQGAQTFPFMNTRRKRARFDKRWIKPLALGIAAMLLLLIGIAHLVSFSFYIPELERQLAESLGQRVVVQDIRFSAFPVPHLKLEGVTIGDLASVRIAKARLFPSLSSWFADKKVMRRVELESVTLSEDSVNALSVWSRHQAQAAPINFQHLQVKDAKLAHRLLDLFAFDADMEVDKGRFVKAQMKSTDRRITIDFLPQGDALHVDLSAVSSVLPLEPRLQFDTLKVSALVRGTSLTASSIEGQLYGGSLAGTAQMDWRKGWQFSADIGVRQVAIEPSLLLFTRDIRIEGKLEAKVRVAAQSAALEDLFGAPQLQATFRAKNGEFSGIDLVRALQAPSRSGNVGGKTHFNELTGAMHLANGHYQYRQIKLQGGVISAAGNVDISPERNLSGNLVGELRTRTTAIRTPFTFGGTLASPTLKATPRAVPVPVPAEDEVVQ